MSVAVYLRVSTDRDQESGLQSQELAIRQYLASQGVNNASFFRDRVSGATTNRPGFEQLQQAIAAGNVTTVVCWKLDRLSRSLRDGINVLSDWLDRGVRVVAIAQQIDFSGAVGRMLAAVLLSLAEMERDSIRENTRRGLAAAKARGVRLGKPPRLHADEVRPLVDELGIVAAARQLNATPQGLRACLARAKATPSR